MNTLDAAYAPTRARAFSSGAEIAGLGGTVNSFRPIVQYKQFIPVQKRRNTIGYNLQGSFITGFGGVVAPPFGRAYLGGENDLRGFDIRTVSPIAYLPSVQSVSLRNPDNSFAPANPAFPVGTNPTGTACISNCYNIPIPYSQLVTPGGDLALNGNLEYRYTIAGPVAIAPFVDAGTVAILRDSQLQINPTQYDNLLSAYFGCPVLNPSLIRAMNRMRPAGRVSAYRNTCGLYRARTGCHGCRQDGIAGDAARDQRPVPHLLRL